MHIQWACSACISQNVTTAAHNLHWRIQLYTCRVNCVCTLCRMLWWLWSGCYCRRWSDWNCCKEKYESCKKFTASLIQICCKHFQLCWHDWANQSPAPTMFDFDSSYTQIMIYVTKLLLRNCKRWNFRLRLEDHSSQTLSQFVMSVQSYLTWQGTFTRKNKVHIMMKNPVCKSH